MHLAIASHDDSDVRQIVTCPFVPRCNRTPDSLILSVTDKNYPPVGSLKLFDAFGDGSKIEVHLRLFEGPQCLLAIGSVQPMDADVWQTLIEAASCLPCKPSKH